MMDYQIQIIRSSRKSLGFQIRKAGVLIVRAPQRMPESEIHRMVRKQEVWIQEHMEAMARREALAPQIRKYTEAELRAMAEQAAERIAPRVRYYAELLGVTYGRITIRNQKTRWGSCSARGNLNFNCLLSQTPDSVLDYVVVHELCHRKEMNHSKQFWSLVEQVLPEYRREKEWLKEHGGQLIAGI